MMKKFDPNATCTITDLIDVEVNLMLIADRYHDKAENSRTESEKKSWEALSDNSASEAIVIENTIWELFKTDLDAVENEVEKRFAELKEAKEI